MRLIVLFVLLAASHVRAEPFVIRGATMGTTYHVKIASAPQAVAPVQLQEKVDEVLAEIDEQMSTYRPDSELSRFNRAPAGEWFAVSVPTAEVVAAAQRISDKTDGALDVTVGPLVRLWHFGPRDFGKETANEGFTPPSDEELEAARESVGYKLLRVRMNPPALRKEQQNLEVDLSSIAPGYAIDRLAELLVRHGFNDFLVEIGGEVRTAGELAVGKPWRVAIERPLAHGRAMQAAVPLSNAAIATAGDNRKYFEYAGRRYSHILDPSTGRPIEDTLVSVTVVADTCMAAVGWDTPLLVLGHKRGYECAERHGIAALFVARGEKHDSVRVTSTWRKRFDVKAP
jgi:thiamine biosynthesis lipoprotein